MNLIEKIDRQTAHRYLLVIDEKWFYKTSVGNAQTRKCWEHQDPSGDNRPTIPKLSSMDQKYMAIVAVNFEGLSYIQKS